MHSFLLRGMVYLIMGSALVACSPGLSREPVERTRQTHSKKLEPTESSIFSTARLNRPIVLALPPDVVSSEALEENIAQAKVTQSVLPKVTQAEVVEKNGRRWLEVMADAQEVWEKLAQFWADNEVELSEFEPAAGVMQTEWINAGDLARNDESTPLGTIRQLFGRVVAGDAIYDRYQLRLERAGTDMTRVYVAHESTRRVKEGGTQKKLSDFTWVSEPENPESVARLLQTLRQLFRTT